MRPYIIASALALLAALPAAAQPAGGAKATAAKPAAPSVSETWTQRHDRELLTNQAKLSCSVVEAKIQQAQAECAAAAERARNAGAEFPTPARAAR